jgi:hypothetical protein
LEPLDPPPLAWWANRNRLPLSGVAGSAVGVRTNASHQLADSASDHAGLAVEVRGERRPPLARPIMEHNHEPQLTGPSGALVERAGDHAAAAN